MTVSPAYCRSVAHEESKAVIITESYTASSLS